MDSTANWRSVSDAADELVVVMSVMEECGGPVSDAEGEVRAAPLARVDGEYKIPNRCRSASRAAPLQRARIRNPDAETIPARRVLSYKSTNYHTT